MSQQNSQTGYDPTENFSELAGGLEQQDVARASTASASNAEWSPKTWSDRETVRRQMNAYNRAREDQDKIQLQSATEQFPKESEMQPPTEGFQIGPQLIEERIHNMAVRLDHELPLICDPDGDTWIFVDAPVQQPVLGDDRYQTYIQRYERPFLVQARVLWGLGSSFFERALAPSNQFRVLRRRGLAGKLPTGIKYVVDLTPPIEGDDAVYLTTELCCSEGVVKWFWATQRWGVSKTLVGGLEEYTPQCPSPSQQKDNSHRVHDSRGTLHLVDDKSLSIPQEYTPLRHRAAIERVLIAVQGQDPQIDTAPKMWTTFAVAKYFGIIHSPLTDYIVRWLRAFPNSYFMEVLPEVSLKIADGLQCQQLCRDTFSILVGEEALGNIRRCRDWASGIDYSVHGRRKDDIPEVYQTRVEYASKALLDRVMASFQSLVGVEMYWLEDLPEFKKLLSSDQPNGAISNHSVSLKLRLQSYVRGAIYKVLCSNYLQMPIAHDAVVGNDDLYPRTTWSQIWNCLLPRERILTRSFWRVLKNQDIQYGSSNFDIEDHMLNNTYIPDPETTAAEKFMLREQVFGKVYKAELEDLARMVEAFSYVRAHRALGLTDQSLPSEIANLAISGSRYAVTAASNGDHSSLSDTMDPTLVSTPTSVFHSIKESITTDFQARANERKANDPLNSSSSSQDSLLCFNVDTFLNQVRRYIQPLCDRMLGSGDTNSPLELGLTDTLVCLEDTEWKYLPIWANGNDDGSGGVYNDEIPLAYEGFSTAGPNVHTGTGSSMASSEDYEVIGSHSSDVTRHTSTVVNDGHSSVLHPWRTYAMSEGGESWNAVPAGDHSEAPGLHSLSLNVPSIDTCTTMSASGDGMPMSLDEVDIDEEAKAKWDTARMEHMEKKESVASISPAKYDMEEDISNAFFEEDDDGIDFEIDDDDDSSATELGDPFSDIEAADEDMEDQEIDGEAETETEDAIIV